MHPHLQKSLIALLLLSTLFCPASIAADNLPPDSTLLYVGTYTGQKSKGIYFFRLQPPKESAKASQSPTFLPLGLAAEIQSPSFLTVDLNRHLLFA
ncbi:MAG TPA: beta-propeller fold lactonase family protein, partial [Tepidisphaeraceae bacterium]|nr:beta-propeller fold lactonase family protein [Tepidisphaeraceae bacterium]